MLEKIKALAERVAEYLGVEIIPIEFENIVDDSRLVLRPEVKIVINSKHQDDYFECAKAVTHEYRHLFQIFYANMFNDGRARRWKAELTALVNTSNMNNKGSNYISQELELDAFSFTKYYLDKYESIRINNKIAGYDEIIDKYILFNYKFFYRF